METSLHRELKLLYAGADAQSEVRLGRYRIDAIADGELIEVQHGSLGAIRDKIRSLLKSHPVRIVKPIVARKTLVHRRRAGGRIVRRRLSPKQGRLLDLFDELIHFTRVFPHPRLTLEVLLVEIEEHRYPGHGRRRRWRANDFQVEDQRLIEIQSQHTVATVADLAALIACSLDEPFDTAALAAGMSIPRWSAQRIAYCLRNVGAIEECGKRGNSRQYRWLAAAKRAA
jgi:hypothetical protein